MRLLRKIAREQNRSVIIVSHDQRINDFADRVLWLEDGEFKAINTRAEDPVCRMSVDTETAFEAKYLGETYYFCADGCRVEFLANHSSFITSGDTKSALRPDAEERPV